MAFDKRGLIAVGMLALVSQGWSQISGPAPVAWKWQQSTTVAPGPMETLGETVFTGVGRRVYALDRATGNQKWRYPAGEPMQANFNRGVLLGPNTVVAATDSRVIVGLDAETGAKKWEVTTPQGILGYPVIAGPFVVASLANDTLIAYRIEDGAEGWPAPIAAPGGFFGLIGGGGDNVVFANQQYEVIALDVVSQRFKWKIPFTTLAPNVRPVFNEDTFFVLSGEYIIGLSGVNGGRRVNINAREQLTSLPAVKGDVISVIGESGFLRSFSRSGKTLHLPVDLKSQPANPPSFVGDKVAVNTTNGAMQLVDPMSGRLLWTYFLKTAVKPKPAADGKPVSNVMTAAAPTGFLGTTVFLLGRDGQLQAFDASSGVDLTAPVVKMKFPTAGAEMNGRANAGTGNIQPFFLWELEDEASGVNLETVKVELDGRPAKFQITRDGEILVRINGTDNQGLGDGVRTFTVSVTDWMGNVAKETFKIYIDNTLPPLKSGSGTSGGAGTGDGGRGGFGGGGREGG